MNCSSAYVSFFFCMSSQQKAIFSLSLSRLVTPLSDSLTSNNQEDDGSYGCYGLYCVTASNELLGMNRKLNIIDKVMETNGYF